MTSTAAEKTAETVFALATDGFDPTNWYGPGLVMFRHSQGRLPELVPLLEAAAGQTGLTAVYGAALSVAYGHAGRVDEARTLLRQLVADDLHDVGTNFTWFAAVVALAETAELTGDADAALVLEKALCPYAGRLADLPQAVVAPVDLALAQLALTRGDARRPRGGRHRGPSRRAADEEPWCFLARELVRQAAAGDGGPRPRGRRGARHRRPHGGGPHPAGSRTVGVAVLGPPPAGAGGTGLTTSY